MSKRSLFAAFYLSTVLAGGAITETEFAALHKQVQPEAAAWTSIPWQSSLIPAQKLAVEEGKPLFIWAMDGHPLGCT